jgi:hypothetical protein
MITKDSPLVETSRVRLLMSEHLLRAISQQCWQRDDNVPTNSLDNETLLEFRILLDEMDTQLKEIEAANACYN